jgi:hypothetical protein
VFSCKFFIFLFITPLKEFKIGQRKAKKQEIQTTLSFFSIYFSYLDESSKIPSVTKVTPDSVKIIKKIS